jgi:CelD/BcsL family acetyltransferase involved in cellulose biosynthesis
MVTLEAQKPTVEVLCDESALARISEPWRRLAESTGNPFVTPDWYLAWLGGIGKDAEPRVVVVRDGDGEIRGLLPLVEEHRGGRPVLRFAGADFGDLFHPVAAPEDQAHVAARAGEVLCDSKTIVLDRSGGSAEWARMLTESMPGHLRVDYREAPLPFLRLDHGGWDEYLASRSRNFRNQVGRKLRNLERDHEVSFRQADAETVDEDFEALLDLHRERWLERGGSSALRGEAPGFHREFARAAARNGWLRLWFLVIDGEPAAGWYGWRVGPRYAYYLAGFGSRWGGSSVGFLLLAHTIRSAFEEGAEAYDFLLGGETYKSRFTQEQRDVRTIAIGRRGPAFLQLSTEATLWRAGNHLPPGLRSRAIGAYKRVSLSGRR